MPSLPHQTGYLTERVCCNSSSRKAALGNKSYRASVTVKSLRDTSALHPVLSGPPPKHQHLREILLDDLKGGSHAASSAQNHVYFVIQQVFRRRRRRNQKAEKGLSESTPEQTPPQATARMSSTQADLERTVIASSNTWVKVDILEVQSMLGNIISFPQGQLQRHRWRGWLCCIVGHGVGNFGD